jgi:UDP-glucose 4-epimerase
LIVVTGGAGFIGSNLVDFLINKKYSVCVIDNFSTGKKSNLSHLGNAIKVYDENVAHFNFNSLKNIEAVIHLAAQVSVPVSIEKFKISSKSNICSSITVLEYCSENKIPIIYASSSAVYGNSPLGDDYLNNIDLLSPYAADKYSMEIYANVAHKIYGLSSIGLRFYNVYGPRQDPNSPYSGVISIFIDRLIKGKTIIVNGGNQTRDFIYIDDVVKCIHESLKLAINTRVSHFFNVLSGKSTNINELLEMLIKEIGVNPKVEYKDLPVGDPKVSKGTTKKYTELLGVELDDFIKLQHGLTKTIKYIKNEGL